MHVWAATKLPAAKSTVIAFTKVLEGGALWPLGLQIVFNEAEMQKFLWLMGWTEQHYNTSAAANQQDFSADVHFSGWTSFRAVESRKMAINWWLKGQLITESDTENTTAAHSANQSQSYFWGKSFFPTELLRWLPGSLHLLDLSLTSDHC